MDSTILWILFKQYMVNERDSNNENESSLLSFRTISKLIKKEFKLKGNSKVKVELKVKAELKGKLELKS